MNQTKKESQYVVGGMIELASFEVNRERDEQSENVVEPEILDRRGEVQQGKRKEGHKRMHRGIYSKSAMELLPATRLYTGHGKQAPRKKVTVGVEAHTPSRSRPP